VGQGSQVEGLLVKYLHFYGGFDCIATNRAGIGGSALRSPRPDIRAFRARKVSRRTGLPEDSRRPTDAEMFHYGWARPAAAIRQKREISRDDLSWGQTAIEQELQGAGHLDLDPAPEAVHGDASPRGRGMDRERAHDPERVVGPRALKLAHLRLYISPTGSSG